MVKNDPKINGKNEPKNSEKNCDKMETKLGKSIKYVKLDNAGNVIELVGSGKAEDFRKNDFITAKDYVSRKYDSYWDKDIFKELNIQRILK